MCNDISTLSSNVTKALILMENDSVPGSKFEERPENYIVEQLKLWLKCRGLKLSGKLAELIARVRDCLKSSNHYVLDSSIHDGKWLEAKILKETNAHRVVLSTVKDLSIPCVPKSGFSQDIQSQDIPSLFTKITSTITHWSLYQL